MSSEREREPKIDDEGVSELAKRLAPQTGASHADDPIALRASRPSSFLFFFLLVIALVPSAGLATMMFSSPTLKQALIAESRTVMSVLPSILRSKVNVQTKSHQTSDSQIDTAPKGVAGPPASPLVAIEEQNLLAAQDRTLGRGNDVDEGAASLALEELTPRSGMSLATTDYPVIIPSSVFAPQNSDEQAEVVANEGASPTDVTSVSDAGSLSANREVAANGEPKTDGPTAESVKPPLSNEPETYGGASVSIRQQEDTLMTAEADSAEQENELVLRPEEAERVQSLMAHGHKMVDVGYFAGARAYFKRAAEAGSGEAALALGSTYDPQFIKEIGAHGIEPEPDQARFWYERAGLLNAPGAEAKLERLARRSDVDANSGSPAMFAKPAMEPSNGSNAPDTRKATLSQAEAHSQTWVEPTGAVNLRKEPSPHSEARQVIMRGTKLLVMASEANWFRVTDPKTGEIGWIYSEAVETTSSPAKLGSLTSEADEHTSRR